MDLSNSVRLNRELALGQRKLRTIFENSPLRTRNAGQLFPGDEISNLRTGWACRCPDLSNGRQAIVDVYLPGDVVGIHTALHTRPDRIIALTAVSIGVVPAKDALIDLMGNRAAALYIAWLMAQRHRRVDRLLATISSLDATGRLAVMMLDFYERLKQRRLITGGTYSLPLTQVQIAYYLGLTVVHINRVLRSLRDAGIVSLEKHCVTILDLERLKRLAETGGAVSSSGKGVAEHPFISVVLPAH
jgi:CRP/FNR family transcriptional regulator